jgi:hypothetical protein
MPRLAPVQRQQEFYLYSIDKIRDIRVKMGKNPTESFLQEKAIDLREAYNRDGVMPNELSDLPEWRKKRISAKRAEAGRKGGIEKALNVIIGKEAKKRKPSKPHLSGTSDGGKPWPGNKY